MLKPSFGNHNKEVQHRNQNINPDFTLENESYFKARNGEWRRTARSGDMAQAVERRMKYASDRGARIAGKGQNETCVLLAKASGSAD